MDLFTAIGTQKKIKQSPFSGDWVFQNKSCTEEKNEPYMTKVNYIA